MDMRARDLLDTVVTRFGEGILRDPQRFEGSLRDACGDRFKREARVLVLAVREGIAGELLNARNDPYPELLLARLSSRLEDANSLEASAARWSVESLAQVLKVQVPAPSGATRPAAMPSPLARAASRAAAGMAPPAGPLPRAAPATVVPAAGAPAPGRANAGASGPAPMPAATPTPMLAPGQVPVRPKSTRRRNAVLLLGVIAIAAWVSRPWWRDAGVPSLAGDASAPTARTSSPTLPAANPAESPGGTSPASAPATTAAPVDPGAATPATTVAPVEPGPATPAATAATAMPREPGGVESTDAPRSFDPSAASAAGSPRLALPGAADASDSPSRTASPDVRLLVQKAEAALNEGAVDAADAYVRAALAVEPDNPAAKRVLQQVQARKARDKG